MSAGRVIHVAYVVESWATGVLAVIVLLANSLPRDRFKVTIIHGHRPETPPDFPSLFTRPVTLIAWEAQREVSPRADLASLLSLVRILRDLSPDVVHGQSSKGGALGRIAALLLGIPALYSPHGLGFLGDAAPRKARVYRILEWLLGRLRAPVVASSRGELDAVREVARHSLLLPNMMDAEAIMVPAATPAGGKLRVGAMGRIGPQKNFPLFADVARACAGQFDFVWIGGGEDVSRLVDGLPIRVTGLVPQTQALMELASLDVVIQTSRFEGLSMSLMEAMALSKPVLATPVIGNADLVREGENGYLCADAAQFAARLEILAQQQQLRAVMGARSRAILAEEFSVRVLLPRWMALYERVAKAESGSAQ